MLKYYFQQMKKKNENEKNSDDYIDMNDPIIRDNSILNNDSF